MAAQIFTRKFDISAVAQMVDYERDIDDIIKSLEDVTFSYAVDRLNEGGCFVESAKNVSLLRDLIEMFRGIKPIQR